MDQKSPADEWELSKENVLPLKQGRKVSSLTEGLQPQSNEKALKIREEKQAFEAEVRTYTGDDPLEVWYRYIRWAEETFPKGGKGSNLATILERCVHLFKDEEKYRNDERYIYAWIKTAAACNEPLEIYNFMYDQNIGCEVSSFYESWAWNYEQLGNTKRADAIFQEGLKKGAQPLENLKRKHDEFQKRVARWMMGGGEDDSQDTSPAPETQRQVLSQLKATGKRHTVPVNRTGAAVQGRAGVLGGARPKVVQQVPSKGVQIYSDENSDPSLLPPQAGEWTAVPHRNKINKENEKKPGQWTKAKVRQATANVPISALNDIQQPAFSVHIDDNDQVMSTPAKMPEVGNQILRKPEKPTSYLQQMKAPSQDENQKPMYCKDKIYCGAEEYSFEELRAVRWFKQEEKKKQEQEDAKAIEECRKKLEAEKQLLLDEAEKVRQYRLQLQQEQQAILEESRRKFQEQFERESQLQLQRQQQMLEMDIQRRLQEQAAQQQALVKPKTTTSARHLVFDEGSHGNTENIPPHMVAQLQGSAAKQTGLRPQQQGLEVQSGSSQQGLQLQQAGLGVQSGVSGQTQQALDRSQSSTGGRQNQSLNNSIRTPNSFIIPNSHPSSGESFDRTLSGAPSPTVNTKEAMKLVMGMFNTSLELDKPPTIPEDIQMEEPCSIPQDNKVSTGSVPFLIYDESQQKPAMSAVPFKVFEDQENCCPADVVKPPKRRSLSGILQPSLEVQSDPTEEKDCIVMEEPIANVEPVTNVSSLGQSKKEGKDQELILSSTTPDPEYQWESDNFTIGHHKREPRGQIRTRPAFEDETMDQIIESHARDDITLAPVGSHLSFAAAARFASTPFNPNNSGGARPGKGLDVSDISMTNDDEREAEPIKAEPVIIDKPPNLQDETAPNATQDDGNSFRKNLSPIMEGSSEENDSHGKSHHGHHSTIPSIGHSDTLSKTNQLRSTADSSMKPEHSYLGHNSDNLHPNTAVKPLEASLEQNEDTACLLNAMADSSQTAPLIDISAYIPPEMDEKTENLLSMSICVADPKDPFDTETIEKFLKLLQRPLFMYDNYNSVEELLPDFSKGRVVFLGQSSYKIKKKIGEGGFAKVFVAESEDLDFDTLVLCSQTNKEKAIKVQQPASKWEFYICNEIENRLGALREPVDVRPAMMKIQEGYFYMNGSCLVTEYHSYGTLLDLVNRCKPLQLQNMEPVMTYMTIELLHMVEKLHRCQIIHGDIKPDNFLLLGFPKLPVSGDPAVVFAGKNRFAKLIDFGQSIDMTKYPPNTTFTAKVNTKCFQCIEMKTNRPWTYQTDLFGLAGTIHVLVFDQYMNVYQTGGEWRMTQGFARNWNGGLWKNLFHALLNVPSCDELPNLAELRSQFEDYFVSDLLPKYNVMSQSFMKFLDR